MAGFLGEIALNETIDFTHYHTTGSDGSLKTQTGATLKLYKGNNTTERDTGSGITGVTHTVDFDGNTGIHNISVDTSDNTDPGFFVADEWYTFVLTGATVDSVSGVGGSIGTFKIRNAILCDVFNGSGVTYNLRSIFESDTTAVVSTTAGDWNGSKIVWAPDSSLGSTSPTWVVDSQKVGSVEVFTVGPIKAAPADNDQFYLELGG